MFGRRSAKLALIFQRNMARSVPSKTVLPVIGSPLLFSKTFMFLVGLTPVSIILATLLSVLLSPKTFILSFLWTHIISQNKRGFALLVITSSAAPRCG